MSITCLTIIKDLNESIYKANLELINHMTEPKMKYEWVCVKPNLTYEYFYECMKHKWETSINNFINQPNKCSDRLSEFIKISKYVTPDKISKVKKYISENKTDNNGSGALLTNLNIDDIVLDVIASSLLNPVKIPTFEFEHDCVNMIRSLGIIMIENCQCQIIDIYKTFINKYKQKYYIKFEGKPKHEIIEIFRKDYNKFKQIFDKFNTDSTKISRSDFLNNLVIKLTGLRRFTIEKELNELVPAELGSLKDFFITVISKYYNELHPIIWAQIFKNMMENIFIELPFTFDEIFSFVSKYLLLNSGPFILKILQMIRPILNENMIKKYNLAKLKYPLLDQNQIQLILKKVVYNWDMYKILENFSASVGHVCKVVRVDNPSNIFIIKIIKPIAIAQSCWEYETLYNIYPEGTCEQIFMKNLLESNGRELNVFNEIENINKGYEFYTEKYVDAFSIEINATLTTIKNIPNIIKQNCWFALTMTLAPGVPLSKLIENDLIKNDTRYRAKLHRCLDLLIYKFFQSIIKNGFYHGDLHSGNIFFSYENCQITLIDFGAVGEINIYANDPDIKSMIDIIIMSIFYNYDEMFDKVTEILNSKCTETQIDTSNIEYQQLKQKLYNYKLNNLKNQEEEKQKKEIYRNDIFSDDRIQDEIQADTNISENGSFLSDDVHSIYSYLEYQPKTTETIVENRDILPEFTEIQGNSKNISFTEVFTIITKYYALSGINIAIKFNEFYEIQKAYALLLGVLHKVGYNSYRTSIALNKSIVNWNNVSELRHLGTVIHGSKTYLEEKFKYDELVKQLNHNDL